MRGQNLWLRYRAASASMGSPFSSTPGSSALNAGNSSYCPELDQRGVARVGTCDIGAFEARGFTLAYTGGDYQTAPLTMAFANPLQVTLSETGGVGLGGALITFTGPASGASTNPATFTATTDASGIAGATAPTAIWPTLHCQIAIAAVLTISVAFMKLSVAV